MLAPSPSQQSDQLPYGLVSLWDMMNFKVGTLLTYLKLLEAEAKSLREPPFQESSEPTDALLSLALPSFPAPLPADAIERARMLLEGVANCAAILKSHPVAELLKNADLTLKYPTLGAREILAGELDDIRKILEIEFRDQWFYHYPKGKIQNLRDSVSEWAKISTAFPSAKYDIAQGLDCYACDHSTAAVFHMMRVAEIGLVRLAKELKVKLKKDKPLSHAQWGEIVGAIENTAENVLNAAPAGHGKDSAQAFYNGSASHVRALKDKYRNVVMHSRREFNPHEAGDAIFHTRSFMAGLSEKLSETNGKKIKWKF